MKKYVFLLTLLLLAFICQAQTVYKTKTGSKYHVQTCHYLKSYIQTTVAEAQAEGLSPCSVCSPSARSSSNSLNAYQNSESGKSLNTYSSSTSTESVQCSGTTKAGARCKRKTTSSNGRCYQH